MGKTRQETMSRHDMFEGLKNPKFEKDYMKPSAVTVRQMTAEERIKWNVLNVKEVEG